MAQGVQVVDAGPCTLPLLRRAQRNMRADAALFLEDGAAIPLNALSARLPHRDQRAVALLYARQDFARPALDAPQPVVEDAGACTAYVADVAALFTAEPHSAMPVALYSPNPLAQSLAERVFDRAGLSMRIVEQEIDLLPGPGELGIALNRTGEHCVFSDEYGGLSDAQHQLMIAWTALESGEDTLILPDNATRGIDALVRRYNAKAERVAGEPALWMNALAERSPFQFELHFDGLILAVSALSLLTADGMTLNDWRREMPEVFRRTRAVDIPARQNGRILHAFAQSTPDAATDGGVRLVREGGWAWVGADEQRSRLRIVAEGASAEFAAELCDFCEDRLTALRDAET